MVSKASDDLPEPEGPVITVNARRGIWRSNPFRLCCRAPRTTMKSFIQRNLANQPTPNKGRSVATGSFLLAAPRQPSDQQQDDGAEGRDADRPQVQVAGVDRTPAKPGADQSPEQRADDAEEDGKNASGRITSRHDELGQRSGNE